MKKYIRPQSYILDLLDKNPGRTFFPEDVQMHLNGVKYGKIYSLKSVASMLSRFYRNGLIVRSCRSGYRSANSGFPRSGFVMTKQTPIVPSPIPSAPAKEFRAYVDGIEFRDIESLKAYRNQ